MRRLRTASARLPLPRNYPPPDIQYWVRETPQDLADRCALTATQLEVARRRMRAHLLNGKRPTPTGAQPLLVLPLGGLPSVRNVALRYVTLVQTADSADRQPGGRLHRGR